METEYEISSSVSFASLPNLPISPHLESHPDYLSFNKLSSSLENLLINPSYTDYTDADIVVDDKPIGVHRCLLAARSPFFHHLFSSNAADGPARPRYVLPELLGPVHATVGFEAFDVVLKYLYTGKLKPSPPEVSTCVDEGCTHDACRPAIDYAVELMYASATFQIQELVILLQRRLLYFIEKAVAEDIIPILLVASRCQLQQLFQHCLQRIKDSDLDYLYLKNEIPPEILSNMDLVPPETDTPDQKEKEKILKALDSDDVELLDMLLKESTVGLDDACALHYAAANCDPKVFKEVLRLGYADLNLTNSRGLTVLHVAARRKDPSILLPLLEGGACVLPCTSDGQTALSICRRLTRPKEYNQVIEKGKKSNKDRMCIDLLEGEMPNVSVLGKRSVLSEVTAEKLHMLEYLEERVRMAGMLFPMEAMAAMVAAGADWTPLYKGLMSKGSRGNLKDMDSVSNETSSISAEMLQLKLQALRKTVMIGQRYFPNCSAEIIKFLDDLPDECFLEQGTEEERRYKRRRYIELQKDFRMAFSKDVKARCPFPDRPSNSSSSSSSSSAPIEKQQV